MRRSLLFVVLAIASSCAHDDAVGATAPARPATIGVGASGFSTPTLTVPAGTTVTWTWASDAGDRNVTLDKGVASLTQSSGSFSYTFLGAGTFHYVCTRHPQMRGTIIVRN